LRTSPNRSVVGVEPFDLDLQPVPSYSAAQF
jgi:hypothetical protein